MLRYLRNNCYLGIRFYSNLEDAPLIKMLKFQNIAQHHPFFGFLDPSCNDNDDSGHRTGCFIITYMGGAVDHSSNLSDPVALSSAEAEYNEGFITFMAASHLRKLLCEMGNIDESKMQPTTIYFDSKSALAMGQSCRDIKHTRHILRRYHCVHEGISSNRLNMQWIQTEFQIVDIGTKQAPGPHHKFKLSNNVSTRFNLSLMTMTTAPPTIGITQQERQRAIIRLGWWKGKLYNGNKRKKKKPAISPQLIKNINSCC